MADTPLNVDGKTLLEKIIKSEKLAKKMYELACVEISKRGKNVFALYSAFTNYASYADERNGFTYETQVRILLHNLCGQESRRYHNGYHHLSSSR